MCHSLKRQYTKHKIEQRKTLALLSKYGKYTPLVASLYHVFTMLESTKLLLKLEPMTEARARRDPKKYYQYHRDIGYDTNDRRALKDVVEDLIRKGYLIT